MPAWAGHCALIAALAVLAAPQSVADEESVAWCQRELGQAGVRVAVDAAEQAPSLANSGRRESHVGDVSLLRHSIRVLVVPSSGERTVPGNTAISVANRRYESWALVVGDGAGAVLSEADRACVGAVREASDRGSVDLGDPARAYGTALAPLFSLLGWPSSGAEAATFSARLWPGFGFANLEPQMSRLLLAGDIPAMAQTCDAAVGRTSVGELIRSLHSAEHPCCELLCDDGLANVMVTIGVDHCRLDECLAAVALAVGAEWRRLGNVLFLSTESRLATAGVPTQYLYGEGSVPTEPVGVILGVPAELLTPDSAWSGIWTRQWPIMEFRLGGEGGATERRAMLVAWEPSRASLYALLRVEPPLHCASDSVLGFAEGQGAPLDRAGREALVAATESKGDLDGNELIALAKSVGVELVGVKGTLDEIGEKQGVAIVHLDWGHYVAVTDCDSAFVTLLGADGRRARFPKDALESGMSGILFVSPELLDDMPAH